MGTIIPKSVKCIHSATKNSTYLGDEGLETAPTLGCLFMVHLELYEGYQVFYDVWNKLQYRDL